MSLNLDAAITAPEGRMNPAVCSFSKKLGDVRGHALKLFKGPNTIRFAHGVKGAVNCGSRQRSNTRRPRALGLNYFGIQSVVAQTGQLTPDVQKATFGLKVLLSLDSGLHGQRNSRAGRQCQTRSHHGRGRASDGGQRCAGAADQLNKVNYKINVLVVALAGQVKPVAIVGVENQVITHKNPWVKPLGCCVSSLTFAAAAAVVAETVVLGYAVLANLRLFLWASRKSEVESLETFNVMQPWMPAMFNATGTQGGAA